MVELRVALAVQATKHAWLDVPYYLEARDECEAAHSGIWLQAAL